MIWFKKKIQCKNSEDLPADFVEKDVQSMLFPLNLMQLVYICPKYKISDNVISSNSYLQYLVSLCSTIVFISALFYRFYCRMFRKNSDDYYKIDYDSFSIFDFIFNSIGILINFLSVIFHTNKNVVFVLKFQYIHSFVNDKASFDRFTVGNWFSVIAIFSVCIAITIIICLSLKLPSYNLLCGFILINFDTKIVYAIRFIKLLKDKVNMWNIQAFYSLSLENRDKEEYCRKLHQTYVYILDCYDIYKDCFQQMIVFHCISSFTNSLTYVQIELENLKHGVGNEWFIWIFNGWLAKALVLEILLSLEFEKFYMAMKQVQDTCALMLNSSSSDEEKRLCKNIKRLNKAAFDKMDACGMFYVDANLPLAMAALITNYTLVLLQFAFL